jgi:hypothetical protein
MVEFLKWVSATASIETRRARSKGGVLWCTVCKVVDEAEVKLAIYGPYLQDTQDVIEGLLEGYWY